MDMMETRNKISISHFIPSILFILSIALNAVTGVTRGERRTPGSRDVFEVRTAAEQIHFVKGH
jgi:hypothetical protein